ncbi:MAG: hypothetical protein ABIT08_15850 [Bacteroidia bacterium]
MQFRTLFLSYRKEVMFLNIICHLLGHKWKYKDYKNSIKSDGTKYQFTQMRKCMTCHEHEYKYDKWVKYDLLLPADRQVF